MFILYLVIYAEWYVTFGGVPATEVILAHFDYVVRLVHCYHVDSLNDAPIQMLEFDGVDI